MQPISAMAMAATSSSTYAPCCPWASPLHSKASTRLLQLPHNRPPSKPLCRFLSLPHFRSMRAPSIFAAAVGADNVEVEPATNVKFPISILAPGGSEPLSLVGTGFREKNVAFIRVKVYAVGFYLDNAISACLAAWKGKSCDDLSNQASFFKAVAEAPVEKSIRLVLVRDVDGATFWGALDEALTPRLKAAKAGAAGQEALNAFGEVFRGRTLKQGTTIYLTWIQPFNLQVAVSGDGLIPATVEASIVSAALVAALYDVYLGENPVSPTVKASLASGIASLL